MRPCGPLHVERTGAGPSVLLVHSSGLSGRQWKRLERDLVRRGAAAIVPDLSGHGRSPSWPEPEPFSFHVDVDAIAALIGDEREEVHVVGHSYGGFVAL